MKYPLGAPSTKGPDAEWAASGRLVNFHRKPLAEKVVLRPVLGMRRYGDLNGTFCRALKGVAGSLYGVQGGALYQVAENGVETLLANLDDAPNTTISGNNGDVAVCVDGKYYVWDGSTLTQPAGAAFTSFGSVEFFGQLTVLTEKGGRRVQWSDVANAQSFNALNFATAAERDDNILRGIAVGGVFWVMKETSIEFWSNTAAGLSVIPGTVAETGLKSFRLAAKIPDGVFFVGNDGMAYVGQGTAFRRISTTPLESIIETETPRDAFYYEDEGSKFCVLTFSGRPAWQFSLATGEWTERAEDNGKPWTAKACGEAYGKFIVGTDLGAMFELARVGRDDGRPLICQATGVTIGGGDRFKVNKLMLNAEVGTAQVTDQYRPDDVLLQTNIPDDGDVLASVDTGVIVQPADAGAELLVELQTSRDRGMTWSKPKPRGLGRIGQHNRIVRWRSLGQFRHFTARLTYSGPHDITFGSEAELHG